MEQPRIDAAHLFGIQRKPSKSSTGGRSGRQPSGSIFGRYTHYLGDLLHRVVDDFDVNRRLWDRVGRSSPNGGAARQVTKERPGEQREMHEPARALDRLVDVIPAAIVFIVAVIMAIGAAFLGYPVWAIPLIAIFGAGGAILAIRVLGW
jgi:hypothetical protein